MKPKKIRLEFVVLPAVIVLLVLFILLNNMNKMYSLPELPQFDVESITAVNITKADTDIRLEKSGDTWYIMPQKYKADQTKINDILNGFTGLKLSDLVSQKKEYDRFELNGQNKKMVTVYNGDTVLMTLDVGKAAPTSKHTYVKLPEDDKIYAAIGNLNQNLDQSISDLRDKSVLAFNKDLITEIEIERDQDKIKLIRMETPPAADNPDQTPTYSWITSLGENRESEKVNGLLSTLSTLKCDSFAETPYDLSQATARFKLKGPTETEYDLVIFAEQGEKYPAQSTGSPYTFLLSSWQADEILKPIDDLK